MNKIPTIFDRDWNAIPSNVIDVPNPACAWVFAGEGYATRKYDGVCCAVRNGALWKRREVKNGGATPIDMDIIERDEKTGKIVGWVPVGDGREDQYLREAFALGHAYGNVDGEPFEDGTYEFLGPKSQGNVEKIDHHVLLAHKWAARFADSEFERTFDGIRSFLASRDIEGLVFHHPDGRMAKIKKRDFGMRR